MLQETSDPVLTDERQIQYVIRAENGSVIITEDRPQQVTPHVIGTLLNGQTRKSASLYIYIGY